MCGKWKFSLALSSSCVETASGVFPRSMYENRKFNIIAVNAFSRQVLGHVIKTKRGAYECLRYARYRLRASHTDELEKGERIVYYFIHFLLRCLSNPF